MYQRRRIINYIKPSRFSYLGGFLLFLITSCTTTYVDKVQYIEIDNTYFIKTIVSDLSRSRGSISNEYVNQNTPIANTLQSSITKELQRRNLLDFSREKQLTLEIIIRNYEEGKAAARWLAPGLGETRLDIEAILYDEQKEVLSQSRISRKVSWGGLYTIGAGDRAFDKVAKSLLEEIL